MTEARFIPSAEALRLVVGACGDEVSAAEILLEWAKVDELAATARTHRAAHESGPSVTARDKILTAEDWDWFDEVTPQAFKSGIMSRTGWDSFARDTVTVRMTGLHFEERQLAALVQTLPMGSGPIAQEVSVPVEDDHEWVSARDAVHRIMGATGQGATASLDSIVAYAKTGDLQARSLVLTEDIHRQGSSKQTRVERNALIPLWFWDDFTTRGSKAFNWQAGVFSGHGFRDGKQMTVTLTGVQFEARGLDILDPAAQAAKAAPYIVTTGKSGRPAAGWWEDLIIDIFASIHWGDLKPERQSHIEAAMQDWIGAKGLSASVSTVRKRARKMWEAVQRKDEI